MTKIHAQAKLHGFKVIDKAKQYKNDKKNEEKHKKPRKKESNKTARKRKAKTTIKEQENAKNRKIPKIPKRLRVYEKW